MNHSRWCGAECVCVCWTVKRDKLCTKHATNSTATMLTSLDEWHILFMGFASNNLNTNSCEFVGRPTTRPGWPAHKWKKNNSKYLFLYFEKRWLMVDLLPLLSLSIWYGRFHRLTWCLLLLHNERKSGGEVKMFHSQFLNWPNYAARILTNPNSQRRHNQQSTLRQVGET